MRETRLMKPTLLTAAGNLENQDRGLFLRDGRRMALCVADGADGRSGGLEAAIRAVEFVREHAAHVHTDASCAELLRRMDASIAEDPVAGETTCALAVVTADGLFGASVGDSGIWLIPENGAFLDLSRDQRRKPFIGSGGAWPISFRHPMVSGTLLLASDGLFKYASAKQIVTTCRAHPQDLAAERLIELVRYSSGSLPDDVTVIVWDLSMDNADSGVTGL